jgi:hypothetical protein
MDLPPLTERERAKIRAQSLAVARGRALVRIRFDIYEVHEGGALTLLVRGVRGRDVWETAIQFLEAQRLNDTTG